ncbi:NAD-dependent epimerase/dehydratase family protein [Bacillaceae bacterium]
MKTALVTGCAGFIGSTLCEALLARGYRVTGVDGFTPNYAKWIKEKNLANILSHPAFTWVEGDLRELDLAKLLQNQRYVFHLAAMPGVRSSWGADFQTYVNHNILLTQRLLEAVKNSGVEKMVYASSSSIYGSVSGPTREDKLPVPYSPYGVTKLSAEHLCRLYYENYGVPVVSLRYFTVYGPRQRPDMAFHKFIKRILRHEPITVYGDGRQTRDFTYILDAVEANLLALEKGKAGEAYNIGGNSPVELLAVIRLIERITGMRAKLEFLPEQPGDPRHTWADIGKARNELGYLPQYPLEKGLCEQIAFVRSLYGL